MLMWTLLTYASHLPHLSSFCFGQMCWHNNIWHILYTIQCKDEVKLHIQLENLQTLKNNETIIFTYNIPFQNSLHIAVSTFLAFVYSWWTASLWLAPNLFVCFLLLSVCWTASLWLSVWSKALYLPLSITLSLIDIVFIINFYQPSLFMSQSSIYNHKSTVDWELSMTIYHCN